MKSEQKINQPLYVFLTWLLTGLSLAPAALAYVAVMLGLWRLIGWLAGLW